MFFKSETSKPISLDEMAWIESEYAIKFAEKLQCYSSNVLIFYDNGLYTVSDHKGIHCHPLQGGYSWENELAWNKLYKVFHSTTSRIEAIAACVILKMAHKYV